MSDLDQHLAGIDELLAGNTRPIFDEAHPDKQLPPPPESAINYKGPPGTFDGAMAREIGGSGDNMPNMALRAAPRPAPLAILGGRGNAPLMMPNSPPESEADPSGSTYMKVGGQKSARTPENRIETDYPVAWDRSEPNPVEGQQEIISLLRNLFQGAL